MDMKNNNGLKLITHNILSRSCLDFQGEQSMTTRGNLSNFPHRLDQKYTSLPR